MTQATQKRKTLFIQRAFQGRFIAWIIGLLMLSVVCSALILYLLLSSELGTELQIAHHQILSTWQRLGPAILVGSVLAVVIGGLAAAVVVLYISHKIAGPLYRFERLFEEVGRGNFEVSTSLRQSDQLKGLADAFADMLGQLRVRNQNQQAELGKLIETVKELRNTLPKTSEGEKQLDALEQQLYALVDAVNGAQERT